MRSCPPVLRALVLFLATGGSGVLLAPLDGKEPARADPLPSWNESPTKKAILNFVARATREGGPDFVPPADRIATFDNDGTLWQEQPLAEVTFALSRLKKLALKDGKLSKRGLVKAALAGDIGFLKKVGEKGLLELLLISHAGMTEEEFAADARKFFHTARHPTLKAPFNELGYLPMRELLAHLRANGFQTWICSGGTVDFMRVVAQQMYGIPPQQVIGSSIRRELKVKDGKPVLWRLPELVSFNDKKVKPVNISLHIGKRPVFAAGNVRSGGDVAMLEYCQGRKGPSFQLVINHDDDRREFAYREWNDETLTAAKKHGWNVVSMKNDWRTIFANRPGKKAGE